MRIFAVGDLHLPGGQDKTMDIFGAHWQGHWEKIAADWQKKVAPTDLVLLPGDISWAMTLQNAKQDLDTVRAMPGTKIFLRGNHDYWWSAIGQVRAAITPALAVQNDSVVFENVVVCGTRGWVCPGKNDFTAEDEKIYKREILRLEMSLASAQRAAQGKPIVCMLHYPPFNEKCQASGFTELLEAYKVSQVVYGHLHGAAKESAGEGIKNGVTYHLVSCDYLGFKLKEIGI